MHSFEKILLGLLLAVVGSTLAQCSSGPALDRHLALRDGEKIAIGYADADTTMTLANRSGLPAAAAQRATQADPSLKIIPDQDLQRALDVLGGHDFFKYAKQTPNPESRRQLIVAASDRRYVLTERNVGKDRELAARAFAQSLSSFLVIYNNHEQFSRHRLTAEDLKRASEKLGQRGPRKHP